MSRDEANEMNDIQEKLGEHTEHVLGCQLNIMRCQRKEPQPVGNRNREKHETLP